MAEITDMKKGAKGNPNPNPDEQKPEEKKPSRVKRFFGKVGNGIKQAWESPVATAIGAVIGAAVTVGVNALIHRSSSHSDEIPDEDLLPEPEEAEDLNNVVNE